MLNFDIEARGICRLYLDRPQVHNALDGPLVSALLDKLTFINQNDTIRVVILSGTGKSFSSGADLQWMRAMQKSDNQTNYEDAQHLAQLMYVLYSLNKPTIARINGSALGGAIGLIACCDYAIAVESAQFAFTEVKLGLMPAVITPYIVSAIGLRRTKHLFLSAAKFDADAAAQTGLIQEVVTATQLDDAVDRHVSLLLQGGPIAQQKIKVSLQRYAAIDQNTINHTAKQIADMRASTEGQEGITAFLEKRQPRWPQE